MPFGVAVRRADNLALVDALSIGGTFVDVVSVNGGTSQTFTFPSVPTGQLRVMQAQSGTHSWTVGGNGSGQATLTVTALASNGFYTNGTNLVVLARSTTEQNYGLLVENPEGRAVSTIYPQPRFLGIATVSPTPAGGYVEENGYTITTHIVTLVTGAIERLIYAILPSNSADTWYHISPLKESPAKSASPPRYVKPGSVASAEFVITVFTTAATYQLPKLLVFQADNPTAPSSDTYGLRIWNASGALTFDSGFDHVYYRRIQGDLAYPNDAIAINTHAGLGTNPAVAVPYFMRHISENLGGITQRSRRYVQGVRRNGTSLQSKLMLLSDGTAQVTGATSGTFEYGQRTGLAFAEIDFTRHTTYSPVTVTTPVAPTGGTLQTFNGEAVTGDTYATMTLFTDGTRHAENPVATSLPNWYAPTTTAIGASYWVRATHTSGASNNGWVGPVGSWVSLAAATKWGYEAAVVPASGTRRFEFSTSASGTPIVMTCDVYFEVYAYQPGGGP